MHSSPQADLGVLLFTSILGCGKPFLLHLGLPWARTQFLCASVVDCLSKDLKPFHSLFLKHGTGGHQHKIYSMNADLWVLPQTYGDGIWMEPGNLRFK